MPYIPVNLRGPFQALNEKLIKAAGRHAARRIVEVYALVARRIERALPSEREMTYAFAGMLSCMELEWRGRFGFPITSDGWPGRILPSVIVPEEDGEAAAFANQLFDLLPMGDVTLREGCLNFALTDAMIRACMAGAIQPNEVPALVFSLRESFLRQRSLLEFSRDGVQRRIAALATRLVDDVMKQGDPDLFVSIYFSLLANEAGVGDPANTRYFKQNLASGMLAMAHEAVRRSAGLETIPVRNRNPFALLTHVAFRAHRALITEIGGEIESLGEDLPKKLHRLDHLLRCAMTHGVERDLIASPTDAMKLVEWMRTAWYIGVTWPYERTAEKKNGPLNPDYPIANAA